MAIQNSDSAPPTPDEFGPGSPSSVDDSSDTGTPLDAPLDAPLGTSSSRGPGESPASAASASDPPVNNYIPRRVPSLRTVSDPERSAFTSTSSSLSGTLNNARRPPPSAGNLPMDIMAKARALQAQRMGMSMTPRPGISPQPSGLTSPANGATPMASPLAGGLSGNLRLPVGVGMGRPVPHAMPRSAPAVPGVKKPPSLSERRAMKLASMGPSTPGSPPTSNTPRLFDMMEHAQQGGQQQPSVNGEGRGSHISDFKNYIDTEKGWITFEGAATITRTGVNFASGQAFSISLDEIEVLDELGKGNYGTVYKVRHARPRQPRFSQGLSGFRSSRKSEPDGSGHGDESATAHDGATECGGTTSGKTMAMKEIRLELDEAKFTTILKELVILHECVSPHIIDFYGAFFQEGAVYMCIEYMDGGSIDKLYAGGIPEPVLRKITYATIMGLKTLKEDHNIIHRDVKPTNILVNTRGQVKICDFGVSGNLVASIAKTNIGCQSYMAPERISGGGMSTTGAVGGTYSVQSDIWSLGLTIIECAMGKYPYPAEVSSTIFSQLSAIVEGDPPDLPSEGYTATARDFVRSCLNKIPAKRHTYPMLLAHSWLKALSQPETISEDAEAEDAAAAGAPVPDGADSLLAQATAGKLNINGVEGDSDVTDWVCKVFDLKRKGLMPGTAERPALHAAPLDSISPVTSPSE